MAKKVGASNGSGLPAIPEKPWGEMTKAEKLDHNTDRALDINRAILEAPVNLSNTKLLNIQKEVALATIAQLIRVEGQMREAGDKERRTNAALDRIEAAIKARER